MKLLIGVALHVEAYGGEPSQTLTFKNANATEITIGRKSTQPKHTSENADDLVLFKCPVISRKHARITFPGGASVCITDLRSHHGTHVMKAGETTSSPIPPEVPYFLADGDVLTFGKTVGRDETLVRPVVARIGFINLQSPLPATPATPVSSASSSGPASAGRGTSTGRYGLSSPVSSWSESSSEADSDVDDFVPAHVRPPFLSRPSAWRLLPSPPTCSAARLGLLRNYLPQLHADALGDITDEVFDDVLPFGAQSPIEISSASPSRSPSVVEVQPPPSLPEPGQNVVGAWPLSVSASRGSTPPPEEPVVVSNHFSVVMLPDVPPPSFEPQAIEQQQEKDNAQHAEELFQSFVNAMDVQEDDAADTFECRVEQLKSRLEDLDQRMSQNGDVNNASKDSVPETASSQAALPDDNKDHDIEMPTEEDRLLQIKSVVKVAIEEFRLKMEAERAQEQMALNAKLAEAEALVAEAKALAVHHAEMQAPAQAQTVDTVMTEEQKTTSAPISNLKRKRDEVEDETDPSSSSTSATAHNHHCCVEHTHERPVKRRRSVAMRVVSGVAKTTAIAAVGAVATWSALAFA